MGRTSARGCRTAVLVVTICRSRVPLLLCILPADFLQIMRRTLTQMYSPRQCRTTAALPLCSSTACRCTELARAIWQGAHASLRSSQTAVHSIKTAAVSASQLFLSLRFLPRHKAYVYLLLLLPSCRRTEQPRTRGEGTPPSSGTTKSLKAAYGPWAGPWYSSRRRATRESSTLLCDGRNQGQQLSFPR